MVEAPNVRHGRTLYRENDLGVFKVFALRGKILSGNPEAEVVVHPRNVNDFSDRELIRLAERVDAAVMAIDDGPALIRLNRHFYPRAVTYYPAGHHPARTGQIIITRPGSPCFACCMGARSGTEIETLHGEPSLGIHFAAISQLCAQLVVQELASRWGSPLGPPLRPEVSLIAISNMAGELSPYGPGTRFFRASRDPDCPVCGQHAERR